MTIFNQLFVIPTDATLSYLSSVLSGASMELDLSEFKVEIITTEDDVIALPERVYSAKASSLKVWYDSYLMKSSLILSLISNDLEMRALELNQLGVLRSWYNYYNPYMTIIPSMPGLSKHHRRFVLSAANALVSGAEDYSLEFSNEYVAHTALEAPINADYNMAMWEERQSRQNMPSK